ncbi:MAG: hypothetical protein AB7I44_19730 [Hyphomicrobiaceae bacterium]|nr:hypothetical protein [Nitrospirales bacterium]
MIYTVFSTTNNPIMNWESTLLEYSWKQVNQPGKLIRLLSTRNRTQLPSHCEAQIILTWPWTTHPMTGDRYPVYNKPASLSQWLQLHKPEGTILLIDPDCVFRAPILQEAMEGHPVGQNWVNLNLDLPYPPTGRPAREIVNRFCRNNRELVVGVMIPTLIHTIDLKRIMPRWLELTALIRRDVPDQQGNGLWESDMFAYIIAAAEHGLVHEVGNLGICTHWAPQDVPNAPIIHYCHPIMSKNQEKIWYKGSYIPWEDVPAPDLAEHDFGRDLLQLVDRCRKHQLEADSCPDHTSADINLYI